MERQEKVNEVIYHLDKETLDFFDLFNEGSNYRMGVLESSALDTYMDTNMYIGIDKILDAANHRRFMYKGENISYDIYGKLYDIIRKIADTFMIELEDTAKAFVRSKTYEDFIDLDNGMFKDDYDYIKIAKKYLIEVNLDWATRKSFIDDALKNTELDYDEIVDTKCFNEMTLTSIRNRIPRMKASA